MRRPHGESSAGLPPVPAGSSIERLPYDGDSVPAIARELGQPVGLAPFRVRTEPVFRLHVPVSAGPVTPNGRSRPTTSEPDRPTTVLTLWPSLGRVDATGPSASVVATGIVAIDLVRGVEVIFRHAGGSVTVARNGRIMVRTGVEPKV